MFGWVLPLLSSAFIVLIDPQDLGGQTSIRPYWRCYYANTAAVIFVIDSTDIERLGTAAEELSAMLNEEELRDAALLVFANKQDQPGAKGAGEISEALRLGELKDRNWSIVACSAIDGRGVPEGMDWLVVSFEPAFGDVSSSMLMDTRELYNRTALDACRESKTPSWPHDHNDLNEKWKEGHETTSAVAAHGSIIIFHRHPFGT